MPSTTYRADDFISAADRLGIEVVLGTDRCHVLDAAGAVTTVRPSLVLDFRDAEESVRRIAEFHEAAPIGAVIASDDLTTAIAARAAEALGLPHNDPEGARATKDKLRLRLAQKKSGIFVPRFRAVSIAADPRRAALRVERTIGFPCVLKPRTLSMSRGVIRADDVEQFIAAFKRIARLLTDPEIRARGGRAARSIVVEEFVPGVEVALEGILTGGALEVLAIFDKPDRLDGPFFEETIYVTPSRLDDQASLCAVVARAAEYLRLSFGPVHAELRVGPRGIFLVELAPRSIGGLCGRALKFGGSSLSLEELILRHALSLPIDRSSAGASGAMMLPIPRSGMLRAVRGVEEARLVPLVEEVKITAKTGRELIALPEGKEYLGFVIARGPSPELVEAALRKAAALIEAEIAPQLSIVQERTALT